MAHDGMSPRILQTIPILRIFSVEKAKEFYVDYLGFHVDWEHRFDLNAPLYLQVSLENLVLHLSEHYGDACPGATVFIRLHGLADYHRQLHAKNYAYLRPGLGPSEHGSLCMEVVDPFGNRLRFDEKL